MKTAIVIPCYNEENRLDINAFRAFVALNVQYTLCFVNDGSSDNTLTLLNRMRKGLESQIMVVDCVVNGGKAEAVRQGMLHVAHQKQYDYIGFLDADLSTDFADFSHLVHELDRRSTVQMVTGSRVKRLGADITRNLKRHLIGRGMATVIGIILEMPIYDTQCGAKVFRGELVSWLFQKPFQSKWLFDVELFFRMKNQFGVSTAMKAIYELPLQRWVHVGDSKISAKDSVRIPLHIAKIALSYRFMPQWQSQLSVFVQKVENVVLTGSGLLKQGV